MKHLSVRIKQPGKRKAVIENAPLDVSDSVQTLRHLLTEIVKERVAAYNSRTETGNWTKYLTEFDIEAAAESGKAGFDAVYNPKPQNADKAVETALLAFTDGLFRVFVNENELENLDAPLTLQDGQTLTFLRLTMLAG